MKMLQNHWSDFEKDLDFKKAFQSKWCKTLAARVTNDLIKWPGCSPFLVGCPQLRGGSGGGGIGRLHSVYWALERTHWPLVSWNAGVVLMVWLYLVLWWRWQKANGQCFIDGHENFLQIYFFTERFFQMCLRLFLGWLTSLLIPAGHKKLSGQDHPFLSPPSPA